MDTDILGRKSNPAVQAHINMLQGIIDKMGQHSIYCKQWCIAVESIFFGLVKDNMNWWVFGFIVLTTILFLFQDAGYLAFSRHFRTQQKNFVKNINADKDFEEDIFLVKTLKGCERCCAVLDAAFSFFVWPYYVAIIAFMAFFILK